MNPPSASQSFDFHIHTDRSDGRVSPPEVFRAACEQGLAGVSITDHDTLDAYEFLDGVFDELVEGAPNQESGPKSGDASTANLVGEFPWILPGVEFSTRVKDEEELHILGYFPKGISVELRAFVEDVMAARRRRILEGLKNLRDRGVGVVVNDCEAIAGGRVISRAHVASVLLDKRHVTSLNEAYRHLLGDTVFPLPTLDAEETIRVIKDLGGISIWAHPYREQVDRWFDTLVACGVDGLEVLTRWRQAKERRTLLDLAVQHDLLVTGGSDWHGHPGQAELGAFRTTEEQVARFLGRIETAGFFGRILPKGAE